jgi:hypothetical protein
MSRESEAIITTLRQMEATGIYPAMALDSSKPWYEELSRIARENGADWTTCVDAYILTCEGHKLEDVERIIPLIPFMERPRAGYDLKRMVLEAKYAADVG